MLTTFCPHPCLLQGGIQITTSGICTLYYTQASGPPVRRRGLLGTLAAATDAIASMGRSLLSSRGLSQSSTPAAATPATVITIGTSSSSTPTTTPAPVETIPISNSSYWHPQNTQASGQCSDNACQFILVRGCLLEPGPNTCISRIIMH